MPVRDKRSWVSEILPLSDSADGKAPEPGISQKTCLDKPNVQSFREKKRRIIFLISSLHFRVALNVGCDNNQCLMFNLFNYEKKSSDNGSDCTDAD
jgi:hypothetical protein